MEITKKPLPTWILVLSGFFAFLETAVGISMLAAPESVAGNVEVLTDDVAYIVYMWAIRQVALGISFAYATIRRSAAMLTIVYLFFLVMFVGDFVIGSMQSSTSLMASAVVMCAIACFVLYVIRKRSAQVDTV